MQKHHLDKNPWTKEDLAYFDELDKLYGNRSWIIWLSRLTSKYGYSPAEIKKMSKNVSIL